MNHSTIEMARMTVPARLRNCEARSHIVIMMLRHDGDLYGGSSSISAGAGPAKSVFLKTQAAAIAMSTPSAYRLNMTAARSESTPPSFCAGMNVAIISVYTGRRAEHAISGAMRIVVMRSRFEEM